MEVVLTAKQRPDLERLVAQATAPAHEVRRAQVVLWLPQRGCSTTSRWTRNRRRYARRGGCCEAAALSTRSTSEARATITASSRTVVCL
jgi:hypothetical protein